MKNVSFATLHTDAHKHIIALTAIYSHSPQRTEHTISKSMRAFRHSRFMGRCGRREKLGKKETYLKVFASSRKCGIPLSTSWKTNTLKTIWWVWPSQLTIQRIPLPPRNQPETMSISISVCSNEWFLRYRYVFIVNISQDVRMHGKNSTHATKVKARKHTGGAKKPTWNGMDGMERRSLSCFWQLSDVSSRWHTCHRPKRPAFSESKSPTHSTKKRKNIQRNELKQC